MNAPLRRLAVVVAGLFLVLMGAGTWVQALDAGHLRDDPRNARTLYAEAGRQRGPILVGRQAVASSGKVDDRYRYQRSYAGGSLWAAATGRYSIVSGSTGLERTEDEWLSGSSDRLFYRRLSDLVTGHEPAGAVVETTLDADMQQAAAKGLGSQRGAVVALDPRTGDVLAMYSSPSYDPNALAGHDAAKVQGAYQQLLAAPGDPLVDKATSSRYPPGSVFKLIDTAAALESGKYTPDTLVPAPAVLDLPQTTHGLANDDRRPCGPDDQVSLADALRISCNTAYASLGLALGQDALRSQAERFGFGQRFEVPLPVVASTFPASLSPPQLAQSSIGQFDVQATPMQVAMISAAIANKGVLMRPNLVRAVRGNDLKVVDAPEPKELGRAVSEQTAATMTAMMEGVVASGTGVPAQIRGVAVAGKTGTAQHGTDVPPHAWFTAFAPADHPQVAVAVFVQDGGTKGSEASGGKVAAPIARAVIQAALAR